MGEVFDVQGVAEKHVISPQAVVYSLENRIPLLGEIIQYSFSVISEAPARVFIVHARNHVEATSVFTLPLAINSLIKDIVAYSGTPAKTFAEASSLILAASDVCHHWSINVEDCVLKFRNVDGVSQGSIFVVVLSSSCGDSPPSSTVMFNVRGTVGWSLVKTGHGQSAVNANSFSDGRKLGKRNDYAMGSMFTGDKISESHGRKKRDRSPSPKEKATKSKAEKHAKTQKR